MTRNLTLPAMAALLALLFPAGATASPPPSRDDPAALILARVNGSTITLADIRESFASRHEGHGGLMVGQEIIRKVVDKAGEEKLLIQEGRRMGMADEPRFTEAVSAYRDTLLLEALEKRHLHEAAEPTREEIGEAYKLLPRQLHLAIIETHERAKADESRLRLRSGESFDSVARKFSTHQSRTRGGDLGWVTWGVLDEETETVAMRTAAGGVSEPFAMGGMHRIVKVIEDRKGDPPAPGKVSDRIAGILKSRKEGRLRAELLASIRAAHPPVKDAPRIGRLIAPTLPDPNGKLDPPDDAVLMKTATGLSVMAGHVRYTAKRAGLSMPAAWKKAEEDALMFDEARRRIKPDAAMNRRIALFTDARIRDEIERTVILKGLDIDDTEVKAFYEKDPAAFAGPASFHMRHIVLRTRSDAEEIRRRLDAGADFATLAKEKSTDATTAASGGDIGWVNGPGAEASSRPPEGIFALKAGQVSGVVQTRLGYSIVQVLEIKQPAAPPFEQVRHDAAQRLLIKKQYDMRAAFVSRLTKQSSIAISRDAVERAIRIQGREADRRLTVAPPEATVPKQESR